MTARRATTRAGQRPDTKRPATAIASPHDAYLAKRPAQQRAALQSLRETLRTLLPDAEEVISYGVPAFRRERVIVGYGATAKHCALFLFSGGIVEQFAKDLAKHDTSKGAVRFQPELALPKSLVTKLVRARVKEDAAQRT